MEKSIYIQRKRTAGFNLQAQSPDGRPVVSCTRPGIWGNPYQAIRLHSEKFTAFNTGNHTANGIYTNKSEAIRRAVELYLNQVDGIHDYIRHHLQGKHLSCWCAPGTPCHVQDVLLPIINGEI